MKKLMDQKDVFDLVTDSLVSYGYMFEHKEYGVDGATKVFKKHRRPMPGSFDFAEQQAALVEAINNQPTLKDQLDYIRKNEFLQFPVYMNTIKSKYYDMVDKDIAHRL